MSLRLFAISYRQKLQKCCTCKNSPHPETRIWLKPVVDPRGHLVCLRDYSCTGKGHYHISRLHFPSRFSPVFHSSNFATFEIVFLRYGLNLDGLRQCLG